jgi:dGTPase
MGRSDRYRKEVAVDSELRSRSQVDRDRVLYSPHLARLAEVTQVRAVDGEFLVHNRLTHSLKVAQLARRIAERLQMTQSADAETNGLDPDVAETAGLAHDLGHPPFGHIAEIELDRLVRQKSRLPSEGYEGNAQSFRILTSLTVSDTAPAEILAGAPGANLTRASLNAVLKYPWLHRRNPKKTDKWGAYKSERSVFTFAREGYEGFRRSIEAEIMDWADDITYAIHDLADFYCAGLIPLHLLVAQEKKREREAFFDRTCKRVKEIGNKRGYYEEAFNRVRQLCPLDEPYVGSQDQSRDLWSFCSQLIGQYVQAIRIAVPGHPNSDIEIEDAAKAQTTILKQLTWDYVIQRSDLATIQHGQRLMIRELFDVFHSRIIHGKLEYFPEGFAQLIERNQAISPARWTADYISGLTERQVTRLHQRLTGK